MGEGFRVVKKLPPGWGQRLWQRSRDWGRQRGPAKATRFWRRLVSLAGEPLEEILTQPGLGAASLHRLVKWTPILTSFLTSSSSKKWCSRNSESWASASAEPRTCRSEREPASRSSRGRGGLRGFRGGAPLLPGHHLPVLPGRGHPTASAP